VPGCSAGPLPCDSFLIASSLKIKVVNPWLRISFHINTADYGYLGVPWQIFFLTVYLVNYDEIYSNFPLKLATLASELIFIAWLEKEIFTCLIKVTSSAHIGKVRDCQVTDIAKVYKSLSVGLFQQLFN
jgi:hypothetical protein